MISNHSRYVAIGNVRVWKHTDLLGFTVPYVDEIFSYYAEKTYNKAYNYFKEQEIEDMEKFGYTLSDKVLDAKAKNRAEKTTIREIEQGYQAFETKLNTINNSLAQTPFVTISFGLKTDKWARIISQVILKTRKKGLGQHRTTAVFPKLVFLYKSDINGDKNSPNYDIKKLAIQCSATRSYPDYLSVEPGTDQYEYYQECGKAVSPMGKC